MDLKKKDAESGSEMAAIRWCRPNSVYDGVLQFVSKSIVKSIDWEGKVTVLWARKGREPDVWEGTLETAASSQSKSKHTYMYHGLIYELL